MPSEQKGAYGGDLAPYVVGSVPRDFARRPRVKVYYGWQGMGTPAWRASP